MQQIVDFFAQHGEWIFGGGGVVAVIFAIMRFMSAKQAAPSPHVGGNQSIRAEGPIGRFMRRITLRGNFQRTFAPSCCF